MKRLQSNVVVVVATNSKMVYVTLRSSRELPKEAAVEAWNRKAGRSKGDCKRQEESIKFHQGASGTRTGSPFR